MYSKCINCMYAIINLNIFLPWNKHLEQLLRTVTPLKPGLETWRLLKWQFKKVNYPLQANKMRGFTPLTSDRGTPRDSPMQTEREQDLDQNEETEKKPAILMSEGTLQRVAFKERPKPIVPTSSLRKTRRRAGMQLSYSKFWWHYKVYRIHVYFGIFVNLLES